MLERQRHTKLQTDHLFLNCFPHNLTAVKQAADTEAVVSVNPGILNSIHIDQGLSVCLSWLQRPASVSELQMDKTHSPSDCFHLHRAYLSQASGEFSWNLDIVS